MCMEAELSVIHVYTLCQWGSACHEYGIYCLITAGFSFMLSSSSPVYLVCEALVEVLWLLCIVYVIRAQPAELPR